MATSSLYRSLSPDRRLEIVRHALKARKEIRALYVARIVAKGGGFRPVTVAKWPPDQLAEAFVRMNAQTPEDELDLLQVYYLEMHPEIQACFLDAAGVKNDKGVLPEGLEPPYASAEAVAKGAAAVRAQFGEDGAHYLRVIARYNGAAWPGLTDE